MTRPEFMSEPDWRRLQAKAQNFGTHVSLWRGYGQDEVYLVANGELWVWDPVDETFMPMELLGEQVTVKLRR